MFHDNYGISNVDLVMIRLFVQNYQLLFSIDEEFQREINTSVPRAGGREMECHILQGAWDFHEWLEPLGVKVQGLTITDKAPNVVYCYRIVRREDLMKYAGHKHWIIEQDLV